MNENGNNETETEVEVEVEAGDYFVLQCKIRPSKEDRMVIDSWFENATKLYNHMFDRILDLFKGLLGARAGGDPEDTEFRRCWNYGWQVRRRFLLERTDPSKMTEETNLELKGLVDEMEKTRKMLFPDTAPAKVYASCYRRCIEILRGTVINKPEQDAYGYAPCTFSKFGFLGLAGAIAQNAEIDGMVLARNGVNCGIAQGIAERLWDAWDNKLAFKNFGRPIMLNRKRDPIDYMLFKANSGVSIDVANRLVTFSYKDENGSRLSFSAPFANTARERRDWYVDEALERGKPVHTALRTMQMGPTRHLYVQFTMRGKPPRRNVSLGRGRVGVDLGPERVTVCSGDRVEKFDLRGSDARSKRIVELQTRMDALDRKFNPENYNPDGTMKRGARNVHSEEYEELRRRLATLRRRAVAERRCRHGFILNRMVLPMGDSFVTEDDPVQEWVEKTDGHGYGRGVVSSAPGEFVSRLERKAKALGGSLSRVPCRIGATQFDFTDGSFTKRDVSERRFRLSDGHLVDQDAIAAFNLRHVVDGPRAEKTAENFDSKAMKADWNAFVRAQRRVLAGSR